jgi:TPR repeat protein
MRWYRKAADLKYWKAQYKIGMLYANGRGVPKDIAQARAWMQQAAAAGDEDAKKWLAEN